MLRFRRLVLGAVAGPILAAAALSPEWVAARRTHMAQLDAAMIELGQQIVRGHPDRDTVLSRADRIAALAHGIPTWFPKGSGIESGEATLALPEIWEKPDEFAAKAAALGAAAAALQASARQDDMRAVASGANAVDRACISCHKQFRLSD